MADVILTDVPTDVLVALGAKAFSDRLSLDAYMRRLISRDLDDARSAGE